MNLEHKTYVIDYMILIEEKNRVKMQLERNGTNVKINILLSIF